LTQSAIDQAPFAVKIHTGVVEAEIEGRNLKGRRIDDILDAA
jgi:hypothetical protein